MFVSFCFEVPEPDGSLLLCKVYFSTDKYTVYLQPMTFIKAKQQQVIALLVQSLSNFHSHQASG